jgi:hypothetical protein
MFANTDSEAQLNTAAAMAAMIDVLCRAGLTTTAEFQQLQARAKAAIEQRLAAQREELEKANPGLKFLREILGG